MKDIQILLAFVLGLAVGSGGMYFIIGGGNTPRTVNHKIEIEKPHWWPGK
jgi:hypothetical protein